MAFKINIQPEVEKEMDKLISRVPVRSKTEYINIALRKFNAKLRRQMALKGAGGHTGRNF